MPGCSAEVHYFLVESGGIRGHIQLNSGRCPQMALSNTAIIDARPKHKNYRLYDEKGLYLEVTKSGSKLWR